MRDYSVKTDEAKLIYDAMVDDLKHMVRPDWVDLPVRLFKNPKNRLMILKGLSGTGKDVGADFICAELGAPAIHQQWDAGIERGDVTATTGINANPTESDVSPYKIIQGILNKCAERGYVAIIDEANMAVPGVTTLLNGFTDGSRYFNEYDRMVPIHDNFFIILTMNPGYRGTFPFNPSTLTRAALTLDIEPPHVDVEYGWLKKMPDEYGEDHTYKSDKFPKAAYKEIYNLTQAFFDYAAKNTDNVDVTFRQRKRIVDIILFDPLSVDNVKCAFTNALFHTMGVNENDMGKALSFANTPSNHGTFKKITEILKGIVAPEVVAAEREAKAKEDELKRAMAKEELAKKKKPSILDEVKDTDIDNILEGITRDLKGAME